MADYLPPVDDCMRYVSAPIQRAIVQQESSFNPFAIGVVGGVLERQPRTKHEAIATALSLTAKGFNYSVGCRQVNQANLAKYGLTLETAFEPEKNALAGNAIYDECRNRAVAQLGGGFTATKAALSCYYSGNFTRGQQKENIQPSYVEKVLAHLTPDELKQLGQPIKVAAKTERNAKQGASAGSQSDEVSKPATQDKPPPAAWDVFQEF